MSDRFSLRFVAALGAGIALGALASGARFAAAQGAPATAAPLATPNVVAPSQGAGTPLPVPVLSSCANPDLPPAILAGSVPPPAHPLRLVTGVAPKASLALAVVQTPESRETGLMCVTALRPHSGMIFVFPNSAAWDFWMKDTLVPLDMVWLDADGTVTTVAANVPKSTLATPDDAVARRNGTGRYVIELAAGDAALDGLGRGVRVRLPALHAEH